MMRETAVFSLLLFAVIAVSAGPVGSVRAAPGDALTQRQHDYQQQEQQLAAAYQAARENLSDAGKSALKTAERAWVTFKEKDFAIFYSLAREARDTDRILRYATESSGARATYLASLARGPGAGSPSPGFHPVEEVKTAREADQMLNNIYRQCIGILPSDKAQALKAAQSDWITYRDLHCRFDAALKSGRADDSILRDVTMARIVELRHYLTVLLATQLPMPPEDSTSYREKEAPEPMGTPSADLYRFAR